MNLTPAIILIVVAAIVGYVLGIIDSRITASLRKKTEDHDSTKTAAAQPAAEEKNRLGEHTVLRVTIDQAIKWHVELDKVQVDDPNEMNPDQRQRLINIVMQLRPWIDGKSAQTSAPMPTPQPIMPEPAPMRSPVSAIPANTSVASTPAPKINALRGLRSLLNNEVKSPGEMKSMSIVAMIDEVLQAKLQSSTLYNRNIRLEEGSMGEVIVYVGANRYTGVDAVPDEEIRALIKSAINDWEKK